MLRTSCPPVSMARQPGRPKPQACAERCERAAGQTGRSRLIAPDLIEPECANILGSKHRPGQLTSAEAFIAAQLLQRADTELSAMGAQRLRASEPPIGPGHPAWDCLYIALAPDTACLFTSADERLLRKVQKRSCPELAATLLDLKPEAASV